MRRPLPGLPRRASQPMAVSPHDPSPGPIAPAARSGSFHPRQPGHRTGGSLLSTAAPSSRGERVTMWRLSVRPTEESNLSPVDVVITSQTGGKAADLARGLGSHLGGSDRRSEERRVGKETTE